MIIGIDEVGLGAWAGPLVVCAFAAPDEYWSTKELNDSKKLSKVVRERVSHFLSRTYSHAFHMVSISSEEIDRDGIGSSLVGAMNTALEELVKRVRVPDRVIIDGEPKKVYGAEFFPKADGKFPCVMAASILAKVSRDLVMAQWAQIHPQYGFEKHVGYGTKQHFDAIHTHGLCPLHRRSYQPMKSFIA